MNATLYLAWAYLKYHWVKSLILVLSIGLVLFIPLGLNRLVNQSAQQLTARAADTPLIVGTRGSATDLTLSALYFKAPTFEPLQYQEYSDLIDNGHHTIPLHARYQARGFGVIGTTLSYFEHRKLQIDKGRTFTMLGECVIGSEVAQNTSFKVGETVITTPAGAFDVAGSFPLKMKIVGVLKPSGTSDDQVIFADLKTSWLIAGLAHGHQDVVTAPDTLLLSSTDSSVVASAAVLSYTEVNPGNLDSFHFHGDVGQYPIDALMVIPESRRESIQLRGRFEERTDNVQMIVPRTIIDDLVNTMFAVKDSIIAAAIVIGMATAVIVGLVFWLSIKLRRKEIETMKTIGGAKGTINTILGLEIGSILVVSLLLAVGFTLLFGELALSWIQHWITG